MLTPELIFGEDCEKEGVKIPPQKTTIKNNNKKQQQQQQNTNLETFTAHF